MLPSRSTTHAVHSVASFFVSRIDTAVDKLIDERLQRAAPGNAELQGIKGKVAIANAKLAYQRYLRIFSGERWQQRSRAERHEPVADLPSREPGGVNMHNFDRQSELAAGPNRTFR